MSIILSVVDYILHDILLLYSDEHPFTAEDIQNIENKLRPEKIDIFRNPDSDIMEHSDKLYSDQDIPLTLLGSYSPMRSPGIITLYKDNLKQFFHTLVMEILKNGYSINKYEIKAIAKLIVYKTYYHEIFHFDCDVLRCLFGGHIQSNIEEALAVSRSRMRIIAEKYNKFFGLNSNIFDFILKEAYQYTSKGYRDWINYADLNKFKHGLLDYINPSKSVTLINNGVRVKDNIYSILTKNNGIEGRGFVTRTVPETSYYSPYLNLDEEDIDSDDDVYHQNTDPNSIINIPMNRRYFILNTNISYDNKNDEDMLLFGKTSAYFSQKFKIELLSKGDVVFLYRTDTGIIALGNADGVVEKPESKGVPNGEYFMKLQHFIRLSEPLSAKKIKTITNKTLIFRPTMFELDKNSGQAIIKFLLAHFL